jgi:hypothetical protein
LKTLSIGGPTVLTYAFREAANLESVTFIADGVNSIANAGGNNIGAFSGLMKLTTVNIPASGFGVIGSYAFKGCESLKTINIPASVSAIGRNAFENCKSLTSFDLPTTTYNAIEQETFKGSGLTSIDLTGTPVEGINASAFENCKSLETVTIDSTLKNIVANAFKGCESLTTFGDDTDNNADKVIIPNGITNIDPNAFMNCTSISYVVLDTAAAAINRVGASFNGCTGLKTLEVSGTGAPTSGTLNFAKGTANAISTITEIIWGLATYDFADLTGLSSLKKLTVNTTATTTAITSTPAIFPNHAGFDTLEFVTESQSTLVDAFRELKTIKKLIVNTATGEPEGAAISIGDLLPNTINDVYFIGTVNSDVTGIFTGLTDVKVSINVATTPLTSIDVIKTLELREAASGGVILSPVLEQYIVNANNPTLSAVNGVLYDKAQTTIKSYPRAKGVAGSSYEILDSTTTIDQYAFYIVTRLGTLTIPEIVNTINTYAFYMMDNLTTINYKAKRLNTFDDAFPASLVNVNIGNGVTDIPAAFLTSAHVNVTKITIPESVSVIPFQAFTSAPNLTSVTLNANLSSDNAFATSGDTNPIKNVIIGPNVNRLKVNTFMYAKITSVDLKNVVVIEQGAFARTALNSLVIPASVELIGDNAFNSGPALQEVTFAKAGVALGDDVFPAGGGSDDLKDVYELRDPNDPTVGGAGRYVNGASFGWEKRP